MHRRLLSLARLRAWPAIFILPALFAVAPTLHAQSTWGGTSSNLWTDAGNWSPSVPVSGNTALFNNSTATFTSISLGGTAQPIGNITFDTASAAPYTLGVLGSGDQFNVDGGGVISLTSTVTTPQTINAVLNGLGALTITNNVNSASGGLTLAGNISSVGTLTFNNTSPTATATTPLTISGSITSAPSVVYNALTTGTGVINNIIITGTNTYAGPTSITVNTGATGALQIGSDEPFGTGKVTMNLPTTGTNAPNVQSVNAAHTIPNNMDLILGLTLTGTNSLTLGGSLNIGSTTAQRTFNNASTTSGVNFAFGSSGNPSLPVAQQTTMTLGNPVSNGGNGTGLTILLNASANTLITLNDLIQDPGAGGGTASGSLTPQSTGTVRFMNGNSTYSGTTTLTSASTVIQIGASSNAGGTAGPFGTSVISYNQATNPAFQAFGGDQTVANTLNFVTGVLVNDVPTGAAYNADPSGTHNLTFSGPLNFTGTASRTFTVNTFGQSLTLGSAASPSFLTLSATGNINLAINPGNNAGTSPATLVINDVIRDNAVPPATPDTISYNSNGNNTPQGILQLNGASTYAGSTTINGQTSGTPVVGLTVQIGANTAGSPGAITSGPFGKGTLTLAGNANGPPVMEPFGADRTVANALTMTSGFFVQEPTSAQDPTQPHNLTFTGNITDSGKTLTNNLPAGVALTFGTPGTTSTFNLAAAGAVIQNNAGTAGLTVINDAITGASANPLTIKQGGTVLMNGTNTYSGATSVLGTGTVGSGATLGGTGSITASTVTISSATTNQGGILYPGPGGNVPATFNVASMSWQPLGRFVFVHTANSTAVGGGVNGLVSGTGTLDISNLTAGTPFDLNLLPIDFSASPVSQTYTIAAFAGGITGAGNSFGAPFANNTDVSAMFTLSGAYTSATAPYAQIVAYPPLGANAQAIQLSFTPVPEPAFVLAACGGVTALGGWWVRRRRV